MKFKSSIFLTLICVLTFIFAPAGITADEIAAEEHLSTVEKTTVPVEEGERQAVNATASKPQTISDLINGAIFDDTMLLEGFSNHYKKESKSTLLAMIQDKTVDDIKIAAAVRAFREEYALEIFSKEKESAIHLLLRKLNRADSAFIDVEIMWTLCLMDRYKYFKPLMPKLIQKIDHYNNTINKSAYTAINEIIKSGNNHAREARIVFNTLRKILFLSRRRLAQITEPDEKLTRKLKILKWSVKVLGSQELRRLPKEVLNLL